MSPRCNATQRNDSECRSRVSAWCQGTFCLLHCKRDHGEMVCMFESSGGLGNEIGPEAR